MDYKTPLSIDIHHNALNEKKFKTMDSTIASYSLCHSALDTTYITSR